MFKEISGMVLVYILIIVLVICGVGAVAAAQLGILPFYENKRTEIIRNTNEFTAGQQKAMQEDMQAYLDNDVEIAKYEGDASKAGLVQGLKNQQLGLLNDMVYRRNQLRDNGAGKFILPTHAAFLSAHGN